MFNKFSLAFSLPSARKLIGLALLAAPALSWAAAKPLSVREQLVKAGQGLNLETLVIAPDQPQDEPLPVLVMNHGFMLSQQYYRALLTEIAQDGFVVIAPQAYAPGGLPLGKPTTTAEAATLTKAVLWFEDNLEEIVDQKVDFGKLAIISHSRGSKVAWTMMRDKLLAPQALVAIDPVDGSKDGSSRITQSGIELDVPALIIGTGLGGKGGGAFTPACAPTADSFNAFWATASTSPSYLFVASDYGHMDFIDDNANCGMMCKVCATAPQSKSRGDFRSWISSKATKFLRGVLYKDGKALQALQSASGETVKFSTETR